MGLSASQSRLLSLTSRLSDLELKSQTISNAKIRLASASSDASKKYNTALSAKKISYVSGRKDGKDVYSDATAANLLEYNPELTQRYLKNGYGQNVVSPEVAANFKGKTLTEFINAMGYSTFDNTITGASTMGTGLVDQLAAQMNIINGTFTYPDPSGNSGKIADAITKQAAALAAVETLSLANFANGNPVIAALNGFPTDISVDGAGPNSEYYAVTGYATNPPGGVSPHAYTDNALMAALYAKNSSKYGVTNIKAGNAYCLRSDYELAFEYDKSKNSETMNNLYDQSVSNLWNGPFNRGGIGAYINGISDDVAGALGGVDSSYDPAAAAAAKTATYAFYGQRIVKRGNDEASVGYLDNNVDTNAEAKAALSQGGVNMIICASEGGDGENIDDWWIDNNAVVATYLNFYDAYKASTANDDAGKRRDMYKVILPTDGSRALGNNTAVYSERNFNLSIEDYKAALKTNLETLGTRLNALKTANDAKISNPANLTTTNPSAITTALKAMKGIIDQIKSLFASHAAIDSFPIDTLLGYETGGYDYTELNEIKSKLSGLDTAGLKTQLQTGFTSTVTSLGYDPKATAYYTNLYNSMRDNKYVVVGAENMNNPDWLYQQLTLGNIHLEEDIDNDGTYERISYLTDDDEIAIEDDDKAVAKAKAEYDLIMDEIEYKEKRLDLELENIDTEHSSVEKEMESVQKVMDKNIERTFKLFNA